MRVPADVAIVGFDDIERSQYASVPLTTIHQDTQQIGSTAVANLVKRINNGALEIKTIIKPTLVIRASSVRSGMEESTNQPTRGLVS
jgi:DNA-binding LacI/PurR family transcriptional regulator